MIYLEWIASIVALISAGLISYKKVSGFYGCCVSNILWTILALNTQQYGIVFMMSGYFVLNVLGIIAWKNKDL